MGRIRALWRCFGKIPKHRSLSQSFGDGPRVCRRVWLHNLQGRHKIAYMKLSVLGLFLVAGAAFAAPTQEFSTSAGTLKITPIMHASLRLEGGGKILYIDPSQGSYDGMPAADY